MKKILLVACILFSNSLFAQLNMQFRSNLTYGSMTANVGGYVDTLGNEYALVGYWYGLSIVDVTDPDNPVIKFDIPGQASEWREVKTYRQYAYVTTEACCDGLQVVDLSHLPDTVYYKNWNGDGIMNNRIETIHALHIDTATAYCYLYGSNIDTLATNNGYSLFVSLADPWNPHYVGNFIIGSGDPYIHDGYVLNDTMWEGHIYDGFVAVVDVRNKLNPVLLTTFFTPSVFTHNTWLSDDHRTLFTTDEKPNSYLTAYDVSDLQNVTELSRYQTNPGSNSIVHNTHILNDYAITSWYKEGVVVVDESRPTNPVEVANYDTYPQGTGTGFDGDWGVYPFLPSGNILATDMSNGLFVLTPTYVRACWLEGNVTDSITTLNISGASVEILLATNSLRNTDLFGNYASGYGVAGLYDVEVSYPGYTTKTINNVTLTNGAVTTLNVQLVPLLPFSFSGMVIDSSTGLGIPDADVEIANADFDYFAVTDAFGNFNIPSMYQGEYTVTAGKWGFQTRCISGQTIDGSSLPVTMIIPYGFYDDFSFDFGWTVTGTSPNAWVRDVPIGTYNNSQVVNPEADVTTDCNNRCFITDNGGGNYGDHDVDNGYTIVTSPVFDATIYQNPALDYSRWFINIGGSSTPNDSMIIRMSNGTSTFTFETIIHTTGGSGVWVHRNYDIASRITPTNNMRMIVYTNDASPGNVAEGGLDKFSIQGNIILGMKNNETSNHRLAIYPNPFVDATSVSYRNSFSNSSRAEITVSDVLGNILERHSLNSSEGIISIGEKQNAGIYFVNFRDEKGASETLRIIKMK